MCAAYEIGLRIAHESLSPDAVRLAEALGELVYECIVTQDSIYGGKSGYFECLLCGFDFLFADREHHAKDCVVGKARTTLSALKETPNHKEEE